MIGSSIESGDDLSSYLDANLLQTDDSGGEPPDNGRVTKVGYADLDNGKRLFEQRTDFAACFDRTLISLEWSSLYQTVPSNFPHLIIFDDC